MIGVDWLVGLPTTAAGFDQVQVHVDHLSGKVHAVPTRATDTAADAARIILEMALRSGDGVPDVLVVDHDPKFTSKLFKEFTRSIGSSLLVGSAYHKNTNARAERVNGVLGDTLRAFANGRKDDWDVWLPYAVFAINNAASTLGGDLTPFFIDRGQHPRLPLSLPDLRQAGEPVASYATRMKALEQEVQALLHAAQQERKAALDPGRVDTTFHVGDQVMLRTKELLDAAEVGKLRPRWEGPFRVAAVAGPNAYTLTLPRRFKCSPTVNVDRLKPYHPRAGRPDPPGPVSDPGQEGEHVVEQLLNRKTLRGRTFYLVRWQGHASADDSWEPVEHLVHCPERVAEYKAAAPRRPKAIRAQQRAGGSAPVGAAPRGGSAAPGGASSAGPAAWLGRGGRGGLAGAGLDHPLLVAGRGLAAWSRASPQPQGPVHPRGGLPARYGGIRRRGRLAPGRGLLRRPLGRACPRAHLGCSRNGTTVRVGPGNSARIWWCRAGPESAGSQCRSGRCLAAGWPRLASGPAAGNT